MRKRDKYILEKVKTNQVHPFIAKRIEKEAEPLSLKVNGKMRE